MLYWLESKPGRICEVCFLSVFSCMNSGSAEPLMLLFSWIFVQPGKISVHLTGQEKSAILLSTLQVIIE